MATCVGSLPARADEAGPDVARLSVLRGGVDIKRSDSGDTIAGTVNAPLSAGDYLSTHGDGRAEVEYDYGTALRVAPDTQLRFTELATDRHRVQLAAGTVDVRIFRSTRAHPAVETPQATISPLESGRYRVAVAVDGTTEVSTTSGRADVVTDAGRRTLEPGTTLDISGTSAAPQFQTVANAPSDDFERWNDERDAYVAHASDEAYVDQGLVGANDLDGYGRWIEDDRYGRVWSPSVDPGWAPYHDGRFVWEPYYGWTWIANEPWGWAPYHYGNWFYANSGWCWYPGTYGFAQPFVYRPALVGFFSFGNLGVGLGFGNIGWVPLAPYETYYPWYGRGYHNTTVVNNITNITNITNTTTNVTYANPLPTGGLISPRYHNMSAPGAVVGVDRRSFANGDFAHRIAIEPHALQRIVPVRGVLPVVPTAKSLALTPHAPVAPIETTLGARRFKDFAEPLPGAPTFHAEQLAVGAAAAKAFPTLTAPGARPISGGVPGARPISAGAPGARPISGASSGAVTAPGRLPESGNAASTPDRPVLRSPGTVRPVEPTRPVVIDGTRTLAPTDRVPIEGGGVSRSRIDAPVVRRPGSGPRTATLDDSRTVSPWDRFSDRPVTSGISRERYAGSVTPRTYGTARAPRYETRSRMTDAPPRVYRSLDASARSGGLPRGEGVPRGAAGVQHGGAPPSVRVAPQQPIGPSRGAPSQNAGPVHQRMR